jgi:hypothetical protein
MPPFRIAKAKVASSNLVFRSKMPGIREPAAHQDILELGACNCNTHEIRLL